MAELSGLIKQMQLDRESADRRMEALMELFIAQQRNVQGNGDSTIDVKSKNLAESMEAFVYDAASGAIFELWFKRYETIFTAEVNGWTNPQKIRLLMRKFSQADYEVFANKCLPKVPTDLTLEEAVASLKEQFGRAESKFAMRFKCFDIRIGEAETYREYGARINKLGEDFDIANTSADDLKTLLFISGLKDSKHDFVLEKLLNKITEQQRKLDTAVNEVARTAIVKLKVNDLINTAQTVISLKRDKAEVSETTCDKTEVYAIQDTRAKSRTSKPFSNNRAQRTPRRPCSYCGGEHFDNACDFKGICETCKSTFHRTGFCNSAEKAVRLKLDRFSSSKINSIGIDDASTRKHARVCINRCWVRLQLDSGSDITVISYKCWRRIGSPQLVTPEITPASASGHAVKLWGSFKCHMTLKGKQADGICHVSSSLDLLGNDWMTKLGLWSVPLDTVCNSITSEKLSRVATAKFPELFSEGLGVCSKMTAAMILKPDARKVFIKARPLPFAAIQPVEQEIKRCVDQGIYTSVDYSIYTYPLELCERRVKDKNLMPLWNFIVTNTKYHTSLSSIILSQSGLYSTAVLLAMHRGACLDVFSCLVSTADHVLGEFHRDFKPNKIFEEILMITKFLKSKYSKEQFS